MPATVADGAGMHARPPRCTRGVAPPRLAAMNPPRTSLRRQVAIYGVLGGVLIAMLRMIEYRFLVLEHSRDVYGGLIATLFAAAGVWLGLRLNRPRVRIVEREVAVPAPTVFVRNADELARLGITRRELEILEHIAAGLSNRDIAERLYVSENTVKTHARRVFEKLDARRRTQAVQIAKQLALIP